MIKKSMGIAAAVSLACLVLTGCVSEGGGYSTYEQSSYSDYDRPGYRYPARRDRVYDRVVVREDRYDRPVVRPGYGRPVVRPSYGRPVVRPGYDRPVGRPGYERPTVRPARDVVVRDRDRRNAGDRDRSRGRYEVRDGRRIWIPDR